MLGGDKLVGSGRIGVLTTYEFSVTTGLFICTAQATVIDFTIMGIGYDVGSYLQGGGGL